VLEWLETTPVAVWVGESPSIWALPTILTLHTAGMAVVVGASYVLDLRLLGINRGVPLSAFRWVFPVIGVGLAINVATGALLFVKSATIWGTSIPFLVKMGLVVASASTILPIRSLVLRSDEQPIDGPSARWLAVASIVAWAGAVTAGRLLAYL